MLKSRQRIAAALALVGLWAAAAWVIVGYETDRRIGQLVGHERLEAQHNVESVAVNLRNTFDHLHTVPAILADDPAIDAVLSRFGPAVQASPLPYAERHRVWRSDPELWALSRRLSRIVSVPGVEIDAIAVLNSAGDAVAVGVLPEGVNYIGENYGDRDYFEAARRGRIGRQFGVGRLTGVPAVVFAAPVFSAGRFIGAVAIRATTERLSSFLGPGMFLTDANDVIVIAKDPGLVMRAMPKARIENIPVAQRQALYSRNAFESVKMAPANVDGIADLVYWQGSSDPSVIIRRGAPDDLLTVNVVSHLVGIDVIRADRYLMAFLLTVIGLLVVVSGTGAAAFVRARIRHNRDLQELNRALTLQARTDPLTGCANRRHFLELLEAERQRASRYAKPFSLLALDLDYFKEINDRFGHPAGDEALCHFTNVVGSMLRASDTLGRMGGEEFAILLPESSLGEAVAMAERIRLAFATSLLPSVAITMTVSIGVAELSMAGIETVETLLARADDALYDAKNAGRNQVRTQSRDEYVQPQLEGLDAVSESSRLDQARTGVATGNFHSRVDS